MAIRNRVHSHVAVEAFLLYRGKKVCVLEHNETKIRGVVWDKGEFYEVIIYPKMNEYIITRDGSIRISPYYCPYAVAVLMAVDYQISEKRSSFVHSKTAFNELLPYLIDIQGSKTSEAKFEVIDALFEYVDIQKDNQQFVLMLLLEMHTAFVMYGDADIHKHELYLALIDECTSRIERILQQKNTGLNHCFNCMMVANHERELLTLCSREASVLN